MCVERRSDVTLATWLTLGSEHAEKKKLGLLVDDRVVLETVLERMMDAKWTEGGGVVVDGYPRTMIQALTIKLLYDQMKYLVCNQGARCILSRRYDQCTCVLLLKFHAACNWRCWHRFAARYAPERPCHEEQDAVRLWFSCGLLCTDCRRPLKSLHPSCSRVTTAC